MFHKITSSLFQRKKQLLIIILVRQEYLHTKLISKKQLFGMKPAACYHMRGSWDVYTLESFPFRKNF